MNSMAKIVLTKDGQKILRKDSDIRRGDRVIANIDSDGNVIPIEK